MCRFLLLFISFFSFPSLLKRFRKKHPSFLTFNHFLLLLPYITMAAATTNTTVYATGANPLGFIMSREEEEQGLDFVPQPNLTEAKAIIWQNQMLIPFQITDRLMAFSGPLPDHRYHPEQTTGFFPCFQTTMPVAFDKPRPLDLKFMDPSLRVFRSTPAPGNKEYLAWLNKVQAKKQQRWEELGIFDAIQLSRTGHRVCPPMLLASIFFWEGSTNTFHFPCGMMTPTLFDVATITGLSPLGEIFDPTLPTEMNFNFTNATITKYMQDHYDKSTEEVSDEEHVAFLTYWLSYYLFCPGSVQIAKAYIPLAIQIHEGRKVSLGKLLLAYLYHTLGIASLRIKRLHETPKQLSLSGPYWLLQHWLNATFESHIGYTVSRSILEVMYDRRVEGIKLAFQTPQDESNRPNLLKYVRLFSECKTFIASMAPFSNRCFGPTWFKAVFPGNTPTLRAQLNAIWAAFLTPTLLSHRIESTGKCYGFVSYQPNLVSRQFGLSQMLPKSLYSHDNDICYSGRPFTSRQHLDCLKFHNKQSLEHPTFTFQNSYFTTKEFSEWWSEYYQLFDRDSFIKKLNTAFDKLEDQLTINLSGPDLTNQIEAPAPKPGRKRPSTSNNTTTKKNKTVRKLVVPTESDETTSPPNQESEIFSRPPLPTPPKRRKIVKNIPKVVLKPQTAPTISSSQILPEVT
ncbi:uncharacterized protein LOC131661987 [Vicia villosa]|uniref:uncharacterized protein LOC131661987 n=1 Tax=Vicia villosa TaxID=3911 RepID=UPI00273BAEAE|nr:uncharacterized protein LOC131661987 [Vicia villosa]